MGQKQGKHRHDGEENGSSSPKRSPKRSSKRGSKSSKTPSRESTPPNIETLEHEPGPAREVVTRPKTTAATESVPTKSASPPAKSPTKSSKSPTKSEKKKAKAVKDEAKAVKEEAIVKQEEKHVESGRDPDPQTPVKQEPKELEPLTPLIINDISVVNHLPQATSTPAAPNGIISTGVQPGSPPLSPGSTTDHSASDDEDFTPDQQHGSGSLDRKTDVNFGRFYNTSYLMSGKQDYMKRASLNPVENSKASSPHYHRPPNFSYSKDPPDFLRSRKGSGMMALASGKRVVKVRRSSSPADLKNDEAVKLSTYPAGKPLAPNEVEKIERDDWPGPASPAALLPEILRERRRSRGEKEEDDDEDEVMEDPKIQRELEEISKLKDKSGIGSVIYKELEERMSLPHKALDPWKASRAPSAKYEPRYRTRFQSPMFASPSRFLDRPRRAWDDSDIRGYRSLSTLGNMPIAKPGYGPSYGLTPRAATLPLSGLYGARVDFRYFDFEDHEDGQDRERRQRSTHTSSSTVNTDTSTKREPRVWGVTGAAGYEGPSISLLKLQKSTWHTDATPPVYPYEKLKITNFDLPKDVDSNNLEIHLSDGDFNKFFQMPREKFYRLAEWKRNDMKKKVDLY